ncbi:hypothetical protein AWJ20_1323 [Sugiyamaella lignohabitans]|uniref:SET domain-containing protein n=1 Tax=Sugiyamaella lignohabitans TaxID=796027 RepID=A0A167DLK1_9ASCO|nr:uncharacterized protein AWJ20_1323 [Sugiyamaella lignohabitans]ANB13045.1 hypothetical protein AWJ20_1323 [Sugiyamaella lignohabitans]
MSASKPKNWPEGLIFVTRNVYSKKLAADELAAIGHDVKKQATVRAQNPSNLVKIKKILDPKHPAYGQNGLFAARKLAPGSHVIDYLGYVHNSQDTDPTSDYDIQLDKQSGIAIDAQKWGTEARMINDYRGIQSKPNVKFDDHYVDGQLRVAVFVLNQPISAGDELCINYGKGFWQARVGS